MSFRRGLAGAFALLLLSGCASPAPHYYTLTTAPEMPSAVPPPASFVLRVEPVMLPEQLNQPQLVMRKSNGEIRLSDDALWAAPLPEEIRSALSARLERSLNTTEISSLMPPAGKPVIALRVTVRQLDVWPQHQATLTARWQLQFGAAGNSLTCYSQHQLAAPQDLPALVVLQQKLITTLADDVASAIKSQGCG